MANFSQEIANRITEMRKARGWSLKLLAEKAGTTAPQIMKLEKGDRRLDVQWLEKLADAFEIPFSDLLVGSDSDVQMNFRTVPLIGVIAAGDWREAIQNPIDHIPVPVEVRGANLFALQVDGDSMDKIIPADCMVAINPDDSDLRDGGIYAVMNEEGEATIKQFRVDPARLEPCSTNPRHKPIMIGRTPFSVIGRAVWIAARV